MRKPGPQAIPPLSLAVGALRVVWDRRDDVLRLGLVPALILFGGLVYCWDGIARNLALLRAGQVAEIDGALLSSLLGLSVIYGLAATLLAVNWLRFLLLGPMSAIGLGLSLGRHHIGFLAAAAGLTIALGLALAVLSMPLGYLPAPIDLLAMIALMILLLVAFTRLVFVPAAIAIGQRATPHRAWAATRGNGFRLALALVLVELPIFVAFNLVDFILRAIGFETAAPYAMMFLAAAFQILITVAQASVLAAAYRLLIGIEA